MTEKLRWFETPEIAVSPQSKLWSYHEEINLLDDPCELMMVCEEEDEINGLMKGTTYHELIDKKGAADVRTSLKEGSPELVDKSSGEEGI